MRQLVLCWLLIANICTANVCVTNSVFAEEGVTTESAASTKTVPDDVKGDATQTQSEATETQSDTTETQGDKTQTQSDATQTKSDASPSKGDSAKAVPVQDNPTSSICLNKEEITAKQLEANRLFWNGDYKECEKVCDSLVTGLGGRTKIISENIRPLFNLALCYLLNEKLADAKLILQDLSKFLDKNKSKGLKVTQADVLNLLAECDYIEGRIDKAYDLYSRAWSIYEKEFGKYCKSNVSCLEGISGSLFRLEKYDNSIDILKSLARIEYDSGGEDSLRYSITLRMMSACYKARGDLESAKKLYDYAFAVIRLGTFKRLIEKCDAQKEKRQLSEKEVEQARGRLHRLMFGQSDFESKRNNAASVIPEILGKQAVRCVQRPTNFANWTLPARDAGAEAPPVVIDPTKETRAIVICIHGFSLSRDAFSDFANRFAARGYAVASIDMAGFGSFQAIKGVDVVRPDLWLEQVSNGVHQIKRDNPDLPIILMGESMGGAIALQSAVLVQDKLAGLICSVPAGERYGKTRENIKVGRNLLRSRWRPMDVASDLALQMFSDPEKREEYLNSSKARAMAAPEELVRFQNFMNQNEEAAPKITKLPVIIFQGFSDRLVKPRGTADIYANIASKDKDLIVIGKQEHLVFEQGQCPEWILDSLDGWIDGKILHPEKKQHEAAGIANCDHHSRADTSEQDTAGDTATDDKSRDYSKSNTEEAAMP